MRRRLLAAVAALVLALVGATLLLAYVRGADARAMAGLRTERVLVVDRLVPARTPADQLAGSVTSELLPARAVVPGAVRDLAALAGKVAAVDLQPGEQLLAARFAAAGRLAAPGTAAVPPGDQEVTVSLEPQRALGGQLQAGDTVGVLLSLTAQDGSGQTHAVLHHVPVTRVQGGAAPATGDPTQEASSSTPSANLLVTLGLRAADAEVVVFGQEHGKLWLTLEPADADTGGTSVRSTGDVYGGGH